MTFETAPLPLPPSSSPPPASPLDTGLLGLVMLARYHQIAADPEQLLHEFREDGKAFGTTQILLAAKKLGLKARRVDTEIDRLDKTPLPALAQAKDGRFFILAQVDTNPKTDRNEKERGERGERGKRGEMEEREESGKAIAAEKAERGEKTANPEKREPPKLLIQLPGASRPEILSGEEFAARWNGSLILIASRASLAGALARFDFTWFIPALVKYRRLLSEVLVVSFVLQLFALVTPLFFQVVMDKVLVHRGFSTLDVIAVGLIVVSLFEVLLSGLRAYVFSHTTSRIDVELVSRLFRHLLRLPLAYFQARRVGDTVARVRELENIRAFLTGNALTLVLDLLFSVVFIAVMCFYSVELTLIVLASLPGYFLLSLIITPLLRQRLDEKFRRGAENQAFLVEAVSGVDTLKALAVEAQMIRRWDDQAAAYVAAGFRATVLATLAREGVSIIGKAVTVGTLWLGAHLVISGKLSVGQLIAFNMLAGRVANPIMRLAQLWTDFQQTGIAVERLGEVLNARTELAEAQRAPLPRIRGQIEFDRVVFRYRPDGPEVLRGIALLIRPGEVIGLVGRSGSGKSTLTKLVQRLYLPEHGRVLIDGIDLALADTSSLRRQIGVVLQENRLFCRTIRENIALADPGLPLDKVIQAAKLAGAHEFILELPEGYDTLVGEHGATLSGGQRQRIAIARALINDPRLLIFDEATSALDYESEKIIQDNMHAICRGRTVLIIAHRLSAVRLAQRIVVIERGSIVEQGTHTELLAREEGYYARLYQMQAG